MLLRAFVSKKYYIHNIFTKKLYVAGYYEFLIWNYHLAYHLGFVVKMLWT